MHRPATPPQGRTIMALQRMWHMSKYCACHQGSCWCWQQRPTAPQQQSLVPVTCALFMPWTAAGHPTETTAELGNTSDLCTLRAKGAAADRRTATQQQSLASPLVCKPPTTGPPSPGSSCCTCATTADSASTNNTIYICRLHAADRPTAPQQQS